SADHPGLRAAALGFGESVVMGVAGSGPAYSVATTAAVLIGAVGVLAPASLLYCGLIMFGIVFAFRQLNRLDPNAGASYSWVTSIFSPAIGFFTGWAVIVGSVLFMVSGTLPAAAATLKLLQPGLADNQAAVTLTAAGWMMVIGAIVAKGIKLSSYTQIAFTVFEVGVLTLLVGLAAASFAPAAHAYSPAWFTGAGFTPGLFASGAAIALFAFSGWDVTVNLNEETRDGGRIAGLGSIAAAAVTVVLLVGVNAVALRVLTDAEIDNAGVNIVLALAEKLVPLPWAYVAVIAVMLSTVGTLETSILQFTRTVFAMGRDNVLHPRYARLHPTYRTPWFATLLITMLGLLLLLLSSSLSGIKTVIGDSVNALGFQIAFYYGLAGLACAWHFRKQAMTGLGRFIVLLAWPLLGVGFCLFIAVYNVPTFDWTTNVVGLGGIAIGIVPYIVSRSRLTRYDAILLNPAKQPAPE
ncbi:MAG TPA: APC family permease, partial [Stellaceae bacterium]|nr:APC family permease [Stellaceae bacterium]